MVRAWNALTLRELAAYQGHPTAVSAVAVSADGKTMAAAGFDGKVRRGSLTAGPPEWKPTLTIPAATVGAWAKSGHPMGRAFHGAAALARDPSLDRP